MSCRQVSLLIKNIDSFKNINVLLHFIVRECLLRIKLLYTFFSAKGNTEKNRLSKNSMSFGNEIILYLHT